MINRFDKRIEANGKCFKSLNFSILNTWNFEINISSSPKRQLLHIPVMLGVSWSLRRLIQCCIFSLFSFFFSVGILNSFFYSSHLHWRGSFQRRKEHVYIAWRLKKQLPKNLFSIYRSHSGSPNQNRLPCFAFQINTYLNQKVSNNNTWSKWSTFSILEANG